MIELTPENYSPGLSLQAMFKKVLHRSSANTADQKRTIALGLLFEGTWKESL